MTALYPLLLAPEASERIWGGDALGRLVPSFAALHPKEPIGEAWLVYDRNRILNGALSGRTLQDAAELWGTSLLGTRSAARYGEHYGPQVPLLAKFLDAAQDLSIQVHPDNAYTQEREADSGHLGKAEAWLVLEAAPGSSIVWGFSRPVTAGEVRARALAGTLEDILNVVPVAPGDVVYNPPGTVHALGAGLLIYEIQQSSDLTYRLYDYGRRDASGQERDLHLAPALEVMSLEPGGRAKLAPRPLGAGVTELVRTPFFTLERHELKGTRQLRTELETLELWTLLSGRVEVKAAGETLALGPSASLVLPAALGAFTLAGEGVLLRAYLPE